MPLTLHDFVRKWNASLLNERQGAQLHFHDLCEALGVAHPTEEDGIGAAYIYEKRVTKAGTNEPGYADVWKRGFFAWEYKSKGSDLGKALKQLNEYHAALDNPPLLVVCDFERFEVHTRFENQPSRVFAFTLNDLLKPTDTATCALPPLEVLRALFGDYHQLRPGITAVRVTEAAAADLLQLAERLELEKPNATERPSKQDVAHFMMRIVFCLFADSVGILPNSAFRRLVSNDRFSPMGFNRKLPSLFAAMSERQGFFGPDTIPFFNGGLFKDNRIIQLDLADLGTLHNAAQHDWSHIEPAIFGTLFERSLDINKRSMIGAHYTSPEDILLLVDPVIMAPLIRRWHAVRQSVLDALAEEEAAAEGTHGPDLRLTLQRPALMLLQDWAAELSRVTVLDPACGSGNFLYIALKRLLDLWDEARLFGLAHGLAIGLDPMPGPQQLFGIETDFYAHEIASIVVWIGFLQWKIEHSTDDKHEPVLDVLDNIQHDDAIMRYDASDPAKPYEPVWPAADFIVGNPPFLGGKLLRRELGDKYIGDLFRLYAGRVRAESDLVVYWFEKARAHLEADHVARVGLLATQGIRGGANRAVLERIARTGNIFWAWSDRNWLLNGATVHISLVAFGKGTKESGAPSSNEPDAPPTQELAAPPTQKPGALPTQKPGAPPTQKPGAPPSPTVSSSAKVGSLQRPRPAFLDEPEHAPFLLNGEPVPAIHPDLTSGIDTTSARRLPENRGICFMGTTKVGPFDITAETARKMLAAPLNPHGRPNADVVRPWVNATDITRRSRGMYIIDFGTSMSQQEAALYEMPFEYVKRHVYPARSDNNRQGYAERWWLHGESRPELRAAVNGSPRFIATPSVSKHRVFVWLPARTLPDHAAFAFTRKDDYFFGVLHSRAHELWARAQGTQLREVESGFRYTPDSTFDTFPFPWPPTDEPTSGPGLAQKEAVAAAARRVVQLRDNWLNPPDTPEADLKKRTLTNLYNARPTWLADAHRALDAAVFAAYAWPPTLTTPEILSRLLVLNHARAAAAQTPAISTPRRRLNRRNPRPAPPEESSHPEPG